MKLGFIILAHDRPESIHRLTRMLAADGDRVVIHFDAGASRQDRDEVAGIAAGDPQHIRLISKARCRWGEWSLVEAVLLALREFAAMPDKPDFIHLMSAADFPLRPISDLKEFLRRHPDRDFIECCDIGKRQWVKGGLGRERFRFFFPFNFRTSRKAFDRMVEIQRKLRIRRRMPAGLSPHMGSQWWTLRWSTCAKLLEYIDANPAVVRYFRRTWIPDESFVQTLLAKLVPAEQIADLQLTFHHLTPTGRPYVFYNDHLPLLGRIPHFFVRKVSPQAADLWSAGLEQRSPSGRVPTPKRLARVRDVLRSAIDSNYTLSSYVPGYPRSWEDRFPFSAPQAVVVCVAEDQRYIDDCQQVVSEVPGCVWLGRPFAPREVAIPAPLLERIGMNRASWKLRDDFTREFVQEIMESLPPQTVAVMGWRMGEDDVDLLPLIPHGRVIPLLVGDGPPKPHDASRIAGHFHDISPGLQARLVYGELGTLRAILNELAAIGGA